MKNSKYMLIYIICIIALIVTVWLIPFSKPVTLEAGQVWVLGSPNPYNSWSQTNTVLEVKEGYVLYHTGTREDSSSVLYFTCGSTRIK